MSSIRTRLYNKIITLRLTETQAQELKAKADKQQTSMTDIIRDLICDDLKAV